MLRIVELQDPFLRRPFSFSRIFPPREKKRDPLDEGALEICYQIVGRGTSLMAHLPEGQRVDLLGPLGNGFWVAENRKRFILVGGGIGIAPLLSWAEELNRRKPRRRSAKLSEDQPEVRVLIGGKGREEILGLGECKRMGIAPQVATEDGSLGIRGLATDLLERELMEGRHEASSLYACGPVPMLARVAQIAEQFDLPCQVLLESRMACGVGACLGCTVKVREERLPKGEEAPRGALSSGENSTEISWKEGEGTTGKEGLIPVISEAPPFRYARVCREGPVFDARKIFWE